MRAQHLRHIYECLNNKLLSDEERLDILLTVKNTVKVVKVYFAFVLNQQELKI